ncbi:MAG: hypothetical protein Q8R01_04275 [Ramlibacter sp.]|nr:hypothetical protein [Ramlibacter sp.]
MRRFRLLLAWLVMVAIPLQGLAAASALMCGPGVHGGGVQTATVQHDHEDGQQAQAEHSHATQAEQKTGDDADQTAAPVPHKCGVCAFCCHSVAIAEMPRLVAVPSAPQTALLEPFVLMHSRPAQVLDKPPRA